MIRCGVVFSKCLHCGVESKETYYCWEHEVNKKWTCGNCQIGKVTPRVVEQFED
jgi:hypothetical protein